MQPRLRHHLLTLISLISLVVGAVGAVGAAAPPVDYAVSLGSTATDHSYSCTTDASDNLVVVGFVGATVDMGGGPLANGGLGALTIAKYDPAGGHQWSFLLSASTGGFSPSDIKTDPAGNIYLTGRFFGTVDLGGGPMVANGSGDVFLVKYSPAGVHIWSQSFGGASLDQAYGLGVASNGDLIITGRVASDIDFGGGVLTVTGSVGIFLARFDTDGVHQWSQQFSGGSYQYVNALALDGLGNIVIAGHLASVDLGGGTLTATGSHDPFLAKYDANGNHIWSRLFNGTTTGSVLSVEVDSGGNIAIGGYFADTCNFDTTALVSLGSNDGFLVQCDASGNVQWAHAMGGAINEHVIDVQIDENDSVIGCGGFYQTLQVGGGTPLIGDTLTGDLYVVSYATGGAHDWSMVLGGNVATESRMTMAADQAGAFYAFGEYVNATDVGGVGLTGLGSAEMFVAKFFDPGAVAVVLRSFVATPGSGGVNLSWTFGDVSGLVSYAINRRQDAGVAQVIAIGDVWGARAFHDDSVVAGHTYDYELIVTTTDGFEIRSQLAMVTIPRVVASLSQNSPNPFNPLTTIYYSLSEPAHAVIEIFDVSGALVKRLDAGEMATGSHQVQWDGTNSNGQAVSSGSYYYRMSGTSFVSARKMTLLK